MIARLFQRLAHDVASYPSNPELQVGRGHQRPLCAVYGEPHRQVIIVSHCLAGAQPAAAAGRLHPDSIAAAP
jgi:hypothetical protein